METREPGDAASMRFLACNPAFILMAGKVPRTLAERVFKQGYAVGVVVAKHHPKTIRVAVNRRLVDRKYEAHFSRRTLFHVHDELNEAGLGDVVVIRQCSRTLPRPSPFSFLPAISRARFSPSRNDVVPHLCSSTPPSLYSPPIPFSSAAFEAKAF